MQCQCGSETKLSEAVKGKLKARLEFQVCKSCGRVSGGELFVQRMKVAEDNGGQETARGLFATLDLEKCGDAACLSWRTPGRPDIQPPISATLMMKQYAGRADCLNSG